MPTHSVKAYDLYLKARSIDRSESQSEASITRQRELLDEAVREDPNFVEAWAVLKEVYDVSIESMGRMGWFVPEVGDSRSVCNDLLLKSVNALKKAVSLDAEKIETLIARASGVVGEEHLGSEIPADNSEIRRKVMDLTLQKYPDSAMAW